MILYLFVTSNSLICKTEITGSSRWRHVQGPSPLLRVLLPLLNVLCPPWGRHGGGALNKGAHTRTDMHVPHTRVCTYTLHAYIYTHMCRRYARRSSGTSHWSLIPGVSIMTQNRPISFFPPAFESQAEIHRDRRNLSHLITMLWRMNPE